MVCTSAKGNRQATAEASFTPGGRLRSRAGNRQPEAGVEGGTAHHVGVTPFRVADSDPVVRRSRGRRSVLAIRVDRHRWPGVPTDGGNRPLGPTGTVGPRSEDTGHRGGHTGNQGEPD